MMTRTSRKTVRFAHPFRLACLERTLPAGEYTVVTDEELIQSVSFPAYRRVATMMMVPLSERGSSVAVEMVNIDPEDLSKALVLDLALSAHDRKKESKRAGENP